MIISSTTIATSEMDVPYLRTKHFLFGLFTGDKSYCQAKGRRYYGQNSMCCSGHCKHITFRSDVLFNKSCNMS